MNAPSPVLDLPARAARGFRHDCRCSQLESVRRIEPQIMQVGDGAATPLGAVIHEAIDAASTTEMHASAIR